MELISWFPTPRGPLLNSLIVHVDGVYLVGFGDTFYAQLLSESENETRFLITRIMRSLFREINGPDNPTVKGVFGAFIVFETPPDESNEFVYFIECPAGCTLFHPQSACINATYSRQSPDGSASPCIVFEMFAVRLPEINAFSRRLHFNPNRGGEVRTFQRVDGIPLRSSQVLEPMGEVVVKFWHESRRRVEPGEVFSRVGVEDPLKEVVILRGFQSLTGDSIVRHIFDFRFNRLHLHCMEYIPQQSLFAMLQTGGSSYNFHDRLSMARSCARAVAAVHRLGFVHLDVTPDNLWHRGNMCFAIGDFGKATKLTHELAQFGVPMHGGFKFMHRPIELDSDVPVMVHLPPLDIFSLGVIFYILTFESHPFEPCVHVNHENKNIGDYTIYSASSWAQLCCCISHEFGPPGVVCRNCRMRMKFYKCIRTNSLHLLYPADVRLEGFRIPDDESKDVVLNLLMGMLHPDPSRRFSIEDVLRSPLFGGLG